ncbi:MAG: ketol-acid reductoisomerase [Thermoproteota archaeon]|nr:ketol-acid reductoisomerase [Thermoproteota archaeon]
MPAKKWFDNDVTSDLLKSKTVAVVGYGIQGRAQANNMKDSGLDVIVGLRKEGRTWDLAKRDGQVVKEVADASNLADIIHILVPDMEQAVVYTNSIAPKLSRGKTLSFSHGAAIHWKWIDPPKDVDVIMVAPKGPGQRVRELYQVGFGTPSLVAIYQNYTGKALDIVLAMAKAIGSTRPGVIETTFKEEVETDWFGEQVDLCGGTHSLVLNAFETLVEAGYQPEVAYYECLHELKLIVDLIHKYGISGMYNRVSETARYGGLTRGPRIINPDVKKNMKKVLEDIQSGEFANEWLSVYKKEGKDSFERLMKELKHHQIETVGTEIRGMMWKGDDCQ